MGLLSFFTADKAHKNRTLPLDNDGTYDYPVQKLAIGAEGSASLISDGSPMPMRGVSSYESEVALGNLADRGVWNKFGYRLGLPQNSEQIIASWGGTFDPTTAIMTTAQTFTIAYDQTQDGLGQTGALSLLFTYIDENFTSQIGIHTLGNTGSDVTGFTGLGINRVVVLSNGGDGSNNADITVTATTDGTTQAQIPAGDSVTQACLFHTQISHSFLLDWIWMNALKLSGGGAPRITIKGYSWSRVTLSRYEIFRMDFDTAVDNVISINPSEKLPLGGREVLYFTAESDTNNANVTGRFSGVEVDTS